MISHSHFRSFSRLVVALIAIQQGWVCDLTLLSQEKNEPPSSEKIAEAIRERIKKGGGGKGVLPAPKNLPKGTESRSLRHADLDRRFLLHLPNGHPTTNPVPLVIALHGAWMDGAITESLTGLSDLADEKDFLVAYPDANPNGGPGIWDFWAPKVETPIDERMTEGQDDVGFIAALIRQLVNEKRVDSRRVYLTGISNGAFMTNRLSIDLNDHIAAIAPVAGTGPQIGVDALNPARPMPVIYFHGTEDRLVGIDGSDFITKGKNSLSADEFVAWWVKRHGGPDGAEPQVSMLPDLAPNDGCRVERRVWPAPIVVEYLRIESGGHTWPGGTDKQPEAILGKVCRDIDASALMWEFFSRHSLPESLGE